MTGEMDHFEPRFFKEWVVQRVAEHAPFVVLGMQQNRQVVGLLQGFKSVSLTHQVAVRQDECAGRTTAFRQLAYAVQQIAERCVEKDRIAVK